MNIKDFFKPTKWKIIIFIITVILFLLIFSFFDIKIFPCKVRPVWPNPPAFENSFCNLNWLGLMVSIGVQIQETFLGFLLKILIIFIIPYLIACWAGSFIKSNKKENLKQETTPQNMQKIRKPINKKYLIIGVISAILILLIVFLIVVLFLISNAQPSYKCSYKGETVYYYTSPCCDQYNHLYNRNGEIICAPDGGFSGQGDGKCPDFSMSTCRRIFGIKHTFSIFFQMLHGMIN